MKLLTAVFVLLAVGCNTTREPCPDLREVEVRVYQVKGNSKKLIERFHAAGGTFTVSSELPEPDIPSKPGALVVFQSKTESGEKIITEFFVSETIVAEHTKGEHSADQNPRQRGSACSEPLPADKGRS